MSIDPTRARCGVNHRRGFLFASVALGAALVLPAGARAAQVKVLQGAVRVNGKKASKSTGIRPGDTVETAKGARLVFVVGEDAFLLRGDSKLMLEHNSQGSASVITGLRLLTGGLLAAFAPGPRRIETPTATAGIRGTGVYLEASKEQTYFCTCYGVVELRDKAGVERKTVISGYHTPYIVYANPAEKGRMADTEVKNHTDEELIMLERLVGRTSPIVQRNQKLKEATQPEAAPPAEQKSAPAPEEKKPAPASEEKPLTEKPVTEDTAPSQKAAPEEKPTPSEKPGSKKKGAKKGKGKAKPEPVPSEVPPAREAPPVPDTPPELGPSPQPPQPPQPPAQEYRLPPPRLD